MSKYQLHVTQSLAVTVHVVSYTPGSTRPGGQDSILHLLLGVEPVQMLVVDCILERVASLMDEEEELALFAIEQMKWLDKLVDGEVGALWVRGWCCVGYNGEVGAVWAVMVRLVLCGL